MRQFATLLLLTFIILSFGSQAQYFEGQISYKNYYLDKVTLKPIVDAVAETVIIKGDFQKKDIHNDGSGALDWEIINFKSGERYYQRIYENAPIIKGQVCNGAQDTTLRYIFFDTTIVIAGLSCKVIIEIKGEIKTAEYYYCESFRLKPSHYSCTRFDDLDNFYKKTKGAIIIKLVQYGDDYTSIYQLQEIKQTKIRDSEFEVPKNIKIVDESN